MRRPFALVDVFTAKPYEENPVAVVLDGTDLAFEVRAFSPKDGATAEALRGHEPARPGA